VWFKVAKLARGESRAFGFTFTEDSQAMIINDPSRAVHQISLSLLGSLARGAISQAEEGIVKCLPDKGCVNDFLRNMHEVLFAFIPPFFPMYINPMYSSVFP